MAENRRKPLIRFKGFTDDWEQRKLSEITDVRDGTHDSPHYQSFGYPFITSKNVKNGFINYDDIQYISEADFEEINKRSKVDVNDILMGMIGTIGNMALIRKEPDFAIKNVALIKDTKQVNYLYLYHFLHSKFVEKQLSSGMDGGTQKFIALGNIRNLDILFPSEKEQRRIGVYFEDIDHHITLHQRKLDKLLNIKKSMLDKMFPKKCSKKPEIRFKGFTDDWEQRKLGEIVTVQSGKDYKHLGEGTIPVYGTGGYMLSVDEALSYDDAIGIGRKGTIDKPFLLKSPFWTVDTLFYVIPNSGNNINFVFDVFQIVDWKKKDESTGVPSLSKTIINDVEINTTVYDEQVLLGNFFSGIDHIITLHQRKLEKLKNLKKACLDKMFV